MDFPLQLYPPAAEGGYIINHSDREREGRHGLHALLAKEVDIADIWIASAISELIINPHVVEDSSRPDYKPGTQGW